jgi:hypothetical protein
MKTPTAQKIFASIGSGFLVAGTAAVVHLSTLPVERTLLVHELIGDFVAGLVTMLVCLALHLKYEGVYYRFAMERAAIVAELNHHVRNAVFPMCLAVQRTGDADANRIANEAVDKINIALRDAISDALAQNVSYAESSATVESISGKAAA